MPGTSTIRVTFDEDRIEELWEYNPIALNEPELIRFYVGLGRLLAVEMAGGEPGGLEGFPGMDLGGPPEENENQTQ